MIFPIIIELTEKETTLFPKERKTYNVYGVVFSKTLTDFDCQKRESYSLKNGIDDFEFTPFIQKFLPDWYDLEECSNRAVSAVKEWAKDHIHIGVNGLLIESGSHHIIINCTNVVVRDSNVYYIGGFSHILEINNSKVYRIADDTIVKLIGFNTLVHRITDSSKVESVYGNAIIVNLENEAIIIDCSENCNVDSAADNSIIFTVRDDARVGELKDKAYIGRKLN